MNVAKPITVSENLGSLRPVGFVLYVFTFVCALVFLYLFPYVGRDVVNYLSIMDQIKDNAYFGEPGFIALVKGGQLLGFDNLLIISLMKVGALVLWLAYIWRNVKSPIFGLVCFILIPNLLLSISSSVQFMLAVGVVLHSGYFDVYEKPMSNYRLWTFIILSSFIHYSCLGFLIIGFIDRKIRLIGFIAALVVVYLIFSQYIAQAVEFFGYIKYLDDRFLEISNIKVVTIIVIFAILNLYLVMKNKMPAKLGYGIWALLGSLAFFIIQFPIGNVALLRTLNLLLPILLCASVNRLEGKLGLLVMCLGALLLVANMNNTLAELAPGSLIGF